MPNKPVRHIELDKAIKELLLGLPIKNNVEWDEMQELMAQKNQNTNPMTGLPLNLNTMVAAGTAGSLLNVGTAISLFRKWSGPIYYITGTIIVAVGGYYIFDSSASKKSPKPEVKKEQVNDFQPAHSSSAPATVPSTSTSTAPVAGEVAEPVSSAPSTGPEKEIRSGQALSEKEALVKTRSKTEKTETVKESNEASREASPIVSKRDTSSAFDTQEVVPKNSKVLYYKESLTLDKLEQELTKEKKDSVK